MTITELIAYLEKVRAEHGDLPIYHDAEGQGDFLIEEVDFKVDEPWGHGDCYWPKRVTING